MMEVARVASFESNVLDRFAAGTKLSVVPRLSDQYLGGSEVKSVTVPASGDIKVTVDAGPYWLVDGDGRAVSFTAKESQPSSPASFASKHGGLASAAPGRSLTPNVVTGARGSADIKRRHQPGLLEDRVVSKDEPDPAPNQLDVRGVPQRSDTAFGEATPVDPKEIQPRPTQDDVSGPQRSDTEFGEGTPVPKDEVEPAISQEDAKRGLKQRSDTELGSVEPIQATSPKKAAVKAKARKDSSAAKAAGETPQKPAEKTSKKAQKGK